METPHLRVAMMTNSLIQVDANFAAAKQIMVYDINAEGSEFVDIVHFGRMAKKGPGGGKGCMMDDMEDDDGTGFDPLTERVKALEGCSLLFTLGLSDLAAYRVHGQKVFPVKSEKVRDIDDVIAQVQQLMRMQMPPLWVRRVMRDTDGSRLAQAEEQMA